VKGASRRSDLFSLAGYVNVRLSWCLNELRSSWPQRSLAAVLFSACVLFHVVVSAQKPGCSERWVAASGPILGSAPTDPQKHLLLLAIFDYA
jgi:hypothetical protein